MDSETTLITIKIKPEQPTPCEIPATFVQIWGIYRNV
jgi:hypothetical protein